MRLRSNRPRVAPKRAGALSDDHHGQVTQRQTAATQLVHPASAAAARIATAPPGYLLAHHSSDIARHSHLLTPPPAGRETRTLTTPGHAPGHWHLDIATRDQPGLLAATTSVLARAEIDVIQAVLATWHDGAALQALLITTPRPPNPITLQRAFQTSLNEPLSSPPIVDADIAFDDNPNTLYTPCRIRATDRPGLLHAIAVAITTAGAHIHAAAVTTTNDQAHDHFDLSDHNGHKLNPTIKQTIQTGLHNGITPTPRHLRRRARPPDHPPPTTQTLKPT